jgi:tripartite-type tricarboxylate transporter receptor subunit TctC
MLSFLRAAGRRARRRVVAPFLLAVAATPALAFPEHPVRMIVPYPAGGPNDVLARLVGEKLAAGWPQPVIVENRGGAGGNIATELAAKAKPDGHTLLLHAMAYAVNPSLFAKVPYTFRDFTPVSIVARGPLVLVVPPGVQAQSVADLLALARKQPGKLDYGSGGNGSSLHLAAELFKSQAGVDVVHVPYKGTNDMVPDLLAGRLHLAFASPLVVENHVKAGKLRALGVTSAGRVTGWESVPPIGETVKGYEMDAWYAILVPAATPAPIVQQLARAIDAALASPDARTRIGGQGMVPGGGTPAEAAAYIEAEARKWDRVLRAAGIRAE